MKKPEFGLRSDIYAKKVCVFECANLLGVIVNISWARDANICAESTDLYNITG